MLLKREVFTLAMETSDACPGIPLSSYILQVEDLAAMEISGQKEVLTEHLHSKQGCKNFNRCRPVIHLRPLRGGLFNQAGFCLIISISQQARWRLAFLQGRGALIQGRRRRAFSHDSPRGVEFCIL